MNEPDALGFIIRWYRRDAVDDSLPRGKCTEKVFRARKTYVWAAWGCSASGGTWQGLPRIRRPRTPRQQHHHLSGTTHALNESQAEKTINWVETHEFVDELSSCAVDASRTTRRGGRNTTEGGGSSGGGRRDLQVVPSNSRVRRGDNTRAGPAPPPAARPRPATRARYRRRQVIVALA